MLGCFGAPHLSLPVQKRKIQQKSDDCLFRGAKVSAKRKVQILGVIPARVRREENLSDGKIRVGGFSQLD